MKLLLRVWRQRRADQPGAFEEYPVPDAAPDMTVLELLDRLNETLAERGVDPIAFDSDCREGICGACGITIDGVPHGPVANVATCNQHVRSFADGATVTLEPFRAGSFPVVRDLVVDRAALDRLLAAGGYVSVDAGTAPGADVPDHARGGRAGARLCCVHRLRGVRGRLPKWGGPSRRRSQAGPSRHLRARLGRTRSTRSASPSTCSTPSSARAPPTASAPRCVRLRSRSPPSPPSTASTSARRGVGATIDTARSAGVRGGQQLSVGQVA